MIADVSEAGLIEISIVFLLGGSPAWLLELPFIL
jgi:hypothetical protein